MSGGAAGSADASRAMRLAHAHLNVLGWIGLTVIGTLFTLWPTVLRTRMVAGVPAAARRTFPLAAGGLVVATAGLLAHLAEERRQPLGFLMAASAEAAVTYESRPEDTAP